MTKDAERLREKTCDYKRHTHTCPDQISPGGTLYNSWLWWWVGVVVRGEGEREVSLRPCVLVSSYTPEEFCCCPPSWHSVWGK